MPTLDELKEHAPLVKEGTDLMEKLTDEQRALFLRFFAEAGWDLEKMKGALAAGYCALPDRERMACGTDFARNATEVPLMPEHFRLAFQGRFSVQQKDPVRGL